MVRADLITYLVKEVNDVDWSCLVCAGSASPQTIYGLKYVELTLINSLRGWSTYICPKIPCPKYVSSIEYP